MLFNISDEAKALRMTEAKPEMKSVQIRSFFWSVFSRIRTEYGEIRNISPYSVRMWENTDQKKLCIWTLFTQWKLWLVIKNSTIL